MHVDQLPCLNNVCSVFYQNIDVRVKIFFTKSLPKPKPIAAGISDNCVPALPASMQRRYFLLLDSKFKMLCGSHEWPGKRTIQKMFN
jgi:hypothetical protein